MTTDKRLFAGTLVMVKVSPGRQENYYEAFVGWHASEDEARGAWVAQAVKLHPEARLEGQGIVRDITDVARLGFK